MGFVSQFILVHVGMYFSSINVLSNMHQDLTLDCVALCRFVQYVQLDD